MGASGAGAFTCSYGGADVEPAGRLTLPINQVSNIISCACTFPSSG
jgi:hypothetical protein